MFLFLLLLLLGAVLAIMDLVETNDGSGEGDPLNSEENQVNGSSGESSNNPSSHSQPSSGINIVHVAIPQAQVCKQLRSPLIWGEGRRGAVSRERVFLLIALLCVFSQVQSVIQPTSVIQSTPSLQTACLSKGNIILVSKPNSVIHTTGGSGGGAIQALQVRNSNDQNNRQRNNNAHHSPLQQVIDGGALHEDENTKKRREILARRPSYRKILNELGGCEISGKFPSFISFYLSDDNFLIYFFAEDKGDSPGGIDSDDSNCSSPAPPSGQNNQRTSSSVAISGTHYQTSAGLIKGKQIKEKRTGGYLKNLFPFPSFVFIFLICSSLFFLLLKNNNKTLT